MMIDDTLLNFICSILGNTDKGLSGSEITKICVKYGAIFSVDIPFKSTADFGKFGNKAKNKSNVLYRNLLCFTNEQKEMIIREMLNNPKFIDNDDVSIIKSKLTNTYNPREIVLNKNTKDYDIFISHSSNDVEIVDEFIKYLVNIGVEREKIFCSSISDLGCETSIRNDIRKSMVSSKIFLIFLSNNYYKSEYCLNEEGIIWYIDRIYFLINIENIAVENLKGLISPDTLIKDILNKDDIFVVTKKIFEELKINQTNAVSNYIECMISNVYSIIKRKYNISNPKMLSSIKGKNLDAYETKICDLIYDNPKVTTMDISLTLGLSKQRTLRILNKMQENGIITRVGGRSNNWKFIDNINI